MKFLLITLLSLFVFPVHAAQSLLPAIEKNDLAAVEKLLKAGANINDETGLYTPLVRAIHMESPEMVDLLLNYKADANLPGPYSRLPMDWAIQGHQMAIMDLLLKKVQTSIV